MNIVVLLPWIASCALLVPALTVVPGPRCDANHTRLLLLVDLSHDTNLTLTRLKNIVSYFTTKVEDDIIKNLDVCLVDPFQEKTLFNLTKVNSSREITSAIDQLVMSNVSADEYEPGSILTNKYVIWDLLNMVEHKQYVVVLLLHCHTECILILRDLQYIFNSFKNILMISLLIAPSNMNSKTYDKYYQKDFSTEKQLYLIVDNDDDFTKYNPVSMYACRECPQGWIPYSQTVNTRLSCYSVDTMDSSISWTQASNLCESMKSNLPMFETEDELKFLNNYLRQTKVATTADLEVSLATSAVVYIGLMPKQHWPKNKPFTWINSKPLGLHSILAQIDDGGKQCLALTVPQPKNTEKPDTRWTLVRCDKPKSKILVCELGVNLIHNKDEIIVQLQATSQMSPRRKMLRQTVIDPIISLKEVNRYMMTYFQTPEADTIRFDCKGHQALYYSSVCDGSVDCQNGRDEQYCGTPETGLQLSHLYCGNPNKVSPSRLYVQNSLRCDGIQHCPDRSDEKGCDGCLGRQCEDGTCIPHHWLSRDFEACNLFIGANRTAFINVSYSCKGKCSGLIQFDHEISFCNRNIKVEEYSEGELLYSSWTSKIEWAPKCLYLRGRDERPTGCHDEYQLRHCTTFQCPEGFIKCFNSYCVPVYNVRDGVFDCSFGEDEELFNELNYVHDIYACLKPNQKFNFLTEIHIHEVHICDGVTQCPEGEDEAFCPVPCPTGFSCYKGSVIVTNYTQVQEIKSLNIFDIKTTKFLNISGIDLSKLNETIIFPNLLEIHASNCNLVTLEKIFITYFDNSYTYTVNFSYNRLKGLWEKGPLSKLFNIQFLDLSHNENLTVVEWPAIGSKVLHTLDLSFTGISASKMNLKDYILLRSLNLCNTKLGHLGRLSLPRGLEILNLEKTSLSAEDMTKILTSLSVTSALYVDSYKYCCPQISTGGTPKHACHAPLEAFSSCEDLLSDLFKRSLLWLVAGISFAGNIVVITYRLIYDRGVFKKGYGVFVTNLSVSDFVMGVYLMIIAFTDVHYRGHYVLHESVWRHCALCQTAGFLSTFSSETSIFFVFFITLDRYLVIKFPFGEHRFTKLEVFLSVLSSWILGLILASIPLIHPEWIIYSSNGMCFGLPLAAAPHAGWHYSFGIFICFNFILFLCIACGQFLILRLILSGNNIEMTNAQSVARRVQNVNVAKQLFLVVLSNFLCWFPICVLGFLSMTGYAVSPDTYAWLVVFVMPLNAAVNPMIYTIPFMYNKWQDFKKRENARARRQVNKPATPEI